MKIHSIQARPNAKRPTYFYKLFRVKRQDGRVTTVSVDPVLVTLACKVMPGGLKSVGELVRQAALDYTTDEFKSCSGFVANRLSIEVAKLTEARKANS